jgi:hypothetical protein
MAARHLLALPGIVVFDYAPGLARSYMDADRTQA